MTTGFPTPTLLFLLFVFGDRYTVVGQFLQLLKAYGILDRAVLVDLQQTWKSKGIVRSVGGLIKARSNHFYDERAPE
jgi:hypothetical protein